MRRESLLPGDLITVKRSMFFGPGPADTKVFEAMVLSVTPGDDPSWTNVEYLTFQGFRGELLSQSHDEIKLVIRNGDEIYRDKRRW